MRARSAHIRSAPDACSKASAQHVILEGHQTTVRTMQQPHDICKSHNTIYYVVGSDMIPIFTSSCRFEGEQPFAGAIPQLGCGHSAEAPLLSAPLLSGLLALGDAAWQEPTAGQSGRTSKVL